MTAPLAETIRAHVDALCALGPDRHPGTEANRLAAQYVAEHLERAGATVERLGFETVGWRREGAALAVGETSVAAHPGPYSPPVEATAELAAASTLEGLKAIEKPGCVLLLHGPLASEQLTPRDYPWYGNAEHAAILDAIEAARPVAVIAATGKSPGTTAALSPFPLIEDTGFPIPSAYVSEADGERLLARVGERATVQIRSERFATAGEQPVGRLKGTGEGRVLVTAHFDTKPDTPGALDNAAGTAVVLAVAELLKEARPAPPAGRRGPTVELVAFNGEDHLSSPGEVAYLEAYPRTDDVRLVINVDGAGLPGAPSTVCRFNTGEALDRELDALLGTMPGLAPTEPWFAGDHAIFAMRGVPALAITSSDLARLTEEIAHTPADRPELVDPAVLADAARFVAAVIRRLVA